MTKKTGKKKEKFNYKDKKNIFWQKNFKQNKCCQLIYLFILQ